MLPQCLLVACLVGSVLSSPVPPRASPIIGVVVPSDLLATPKYGMGDSVERAAPCPITSSTTLEIPTGSTTTSTAAFTSSTGAASKNVALKPGNRYQGYGNVSLTSLSAAPVAEMGAAMSRPAKKTNSVQKRDGAVDDDEMEVVVECIEYEDGTLECTDPSQVDIFKRNEMKREQAE